MGPNPELNPLPQPQTEAAQAPEPSRPLTPEETTEGVGILINRLSEYLYSEFRDNLAWAMIRGERNAIMYHEGRTYEYYAGQYIIRLDDSHRSRRGKHVKFRDNNSEGVSLELIHCPDKPTESMIRFYKSTIGGDPPNTTTTLSDAHKWLDEVSPPQEKAPDTST
jgi:hypothetical protein